MWFTWTLSFRKVFFDKNVYVQGTHAHIRDQQLRHTDRDRQRERETETRRVVEVVVYPDTAKVWLR